MSNYFFTSDTHFDHANVIRYSNRPFVDREEMNEKLISNWNSKVKPGDTVYHLGDLAFCTAEKCVRILNRLNGQKFFIMGNHDKIVKQSEEIRSKFVKVSDYKEIRIGDQKICMSHYPMMTWNAAHHG